MHSGSAKIAKHIINLRSVNLISTKRVQTSAFIDNADEDRHVSKHIWDNAKPFNEIPGPKPIPMIGNTWRFLPVIGEYGNKSFTDTATALNDTYGNVVKMEGILGLDDVVYLFDPKDFEIIYRVESQYPQRDIFPSLSYFRDNYMQDIFAEAKGLLTSNGEEWYHFRNKVNPIMMQPRVVKQYVSAVDEITDDFVKKIKNNLDESNKLKTNLLEETKRYTMESISYIGMNTRLGALDESSSSLGYNLVRTSEKVFNLATLLDFKPSLWKIFPTKTFRDSMKANEEQVKLSKSVVEEAIKRIKEEKYKTNLDREASVLEKLYDIDPKVAVVMTIDMILAGAETTSASFVNSLYRLAVHKDKQEKLRQEILHFLPNPSDRLTTEILNQMTYLKACIKESSRLYPIIPGTMRKLSKDIAVSGYRIPKGFLVFLLHARVSVKEGHFPEPNEYLPERWLRENGDSDISYKKAHPFCMMHFGFGARSCIGMRFANLELEMATTSMIRNFDISWNGPPPTKSIFGLNILEEPYNFVYKSI